MRDNPLYNATAQTSATLPLDGFFTALQYNGIEVTPMQIAEATKVVLEYAPKVPDEATLCQYLCPLFATNQAEQDRFKKIFAEHFLQKQDTTTPEPPPVKKQWWKYIIVMLLAIALIGWLIYYVQQGKQPEIDVTYNITGPYNGNEDNNATLQFVAGDTLRATVTASSVDTLRASRAVLKAVYDWGDNTPTDTIGHHIYAHSGFYDTKVLVDVFYKNKWVKKDTQTLRLSICDFENGLVITTTAKNDSIPLHKPMYLTASFNSPRPPTQIVWNIQGDADGQGSNPDHFSGGYAEKKVQDWAAETEGTYTVSCELSYDSMGSPCSYIATKLIYAYDPNKPEADAMLQAANNSKLLKPEYKVKRYWFWVFGGGVLLCMLLSSLFRKLYQRLQKAEEETPLDDKAYQQWLASLSSTQLPADIPFLNKNGLAPPEPDMATVGRLMRRRIEGEALYLHIGKTIDKAVRNSGFFQPVMAPRTYQSEYLLLIEESHLNSQATKLFDYLADTLRRHNVFVEKYYYRYEPLLCYSPALPNGISLDKLSEKYPNHVLVIAGHGHQLIYPYQLMVSTQYQTILARWQHKALLTPLPFADWGRIEKEILPTVIPVFPADIAGHLLMMQALGDSRMNVWQGLQEQASSLYPAEDVDFEDIEELAAYCHLAEWARSKDGNAYNNLLFQWIAALAVYPKIQWDITLDIGKAILDAAGQGHQLNYTNLLRMARMKWMKEGMMPPELRLELLKKLNRSHEVLAREAILAALNEIPTNDVRPGHATYEEKEIQRIINEFNLYAYNPIKYAVYARSKNIFERLWQERKLTDAPVKKYLRNENSQWPTLINNRFSDSTATTESVPVDDYFKPLPPMSKGLAKLYKSLGLLSSLLVGICMLGLIGMVVLQLANTKRFSLFTQQKNQLSTILFVVKDSATDKGDKEINIIVSGSSTSFLDSGSLKLPLSDSVINVNMTLNSVPVYDTFMVIDKDSYEVIIKDKIIEAPAVRVIFELGPDCDDDNLATSTRYIQIAQSATTGIKVIKGPSSGKRNKAGTCINSIQVGHKVDTQLVNKIISRFKQERIYLTRSAATDYGIPDEEIFITSVAEDPSTLVTVDSVAPNRQITPIKPQVYIQVSDASMTADADAFRKRLISKNYEVNKTQLIGGNYNSSIIYYYDQKMINDVKAIQQLYQSFYPKQPLEPKLRNTNEKPSNAIVLWIKKPAPSTIEPDPAPTAIGQRIVSIATKEIGTTEEPLGSKKTKYGDWFDMKRNAGGIADWSGIFVSWVYSQAGAPLNIGTGEKGFSSASSALRYFNSNKLITKTPIPGDIMIVVQKNGYQAGIFWKWVDKSKGTFETIEGNINDPTTGKKNAVAKGRRSIKTQTVYFAHIPYSQPASAF